MSSKVLVLFAVLCLLGSCWGAEESKQGLTRHENIPIEPLGSSSDPDLNQDATFWRLWKFWKWGRRYHPEDRHDYEALPTARGASTARLLRAESGSSLAPRPRGTVRKEIITVFFESMLDYIVDSWDVIEMQKQEESYSHMEKTMSEVTITGRKKKSIAPKPTQKKAKSRSKLDLVDATCDTMHISWWCQPDEKAVIRFKNGNVYEGNISMKSMNGEGRFQWADGTVYLGDFKDNEIVGKGTIKWKDDTWYTGDFLGNLRHGNGLYVDSRHQRSYAGEWHCATKHGKGKLCYSRNKNYYDGEWVFNVRHGFGTREYCPKSVYQGDWDYYVREGKGLMIWPNHDYYKGEWQNGVMSGYGIYIWKNCYNNTMSLPSLNIYRGCWINGKRTGFGLLNLGLGLGSHYKGEFKENKKHGMGKFVTNNGLILKHKKLFIEDSIKPLVLEESCEKLELCTTKRLMHEQVEPMQFDICDTRAGLDYHVIEAIKHFDKQAEVRTLTINRYIENNRFFDSDVGNTTCDLIEKISEGVSEDLIEFEKDALHKAYKCYEKDLNNIYYQYATLCNTERIFFRPILIRLLLWQFYYDCDMNEKGLNLVELDEIYVQNKDWLAVTAHGPFEKVYFWQFVNSLISVASRLYAKTCFPGPKPDTVLASAFRKFMDSDALPNAGRCKGYLAQSVNSFVPLQALYQLYRVLGEPHTVRDFLRAVNRSPHLYMDYPQPDLLDTPDEYLPFGRNAYVVGDEMTFLRDPGEFYPPERPEGEKYEIQPDTELFNFGNLSSKSVLKILGSIFPAVYEDDHLMDVKIKMTFFEFFQAFMACCEESIRVKEEEHRWRELFDPSLASVILPPQPPPTARAPPPPPPTRPGTAVTPNPKSTK